MTDLKIKLNQIVTQKEISAKKIGILYGLSNSIKRNTILIQSKHNQQEQITYECKLPILKYKRKEMSHMFSYLFSKESLSIPDKNFIKRILLDTFDEELISAGTKQFVNYLEMKQMQANTQLNIEQRCFYFIVKGSVQVRSQGYEYSVKSGNVFGELQLLSSVDIESIYCVSTSLILLLKQQHFNRYFKLYFNDIYNKKRQILTQNGCSILNYIPRLSSFIMLNKLREVQLGVGDKLIHAGKQIKEIYLIDNDWKGDRPKNIHHNLLGFIELMKGQAYFQQNLYCMEPNRKIFYFDIEDFKLYVMKNMQQSSYNEKMQPELQLNLRKTNHNDENLHKTGRFMRIRKVRLSLSQKRSSTQSSDFQEYAFKFLRPSDLLSNISVRRHSVNIKQKVVSKKISMSMKHTLHL